MAQKYTRRADPGTAGPDPVPEQAVADEFNGMTARELYREMESLRKENAKWRSKYQSARQEAESARADQLDLADKVDAMIAEHESERSSWQEQAEALQAEWQEQLSTLAEERDHWQAEAESLPDDTAATINELAGQLRTRTHRDAWANATKDVLADGASVDLLWKALGYEPDSDEIDEGTIAERLAEARQTAPIFFRTAGDPASQQPAPGGPQGGRAPVSRPLTEGIDSGRGSRPSEGSKMRVTREDLVNPAFIAQHGAELAKGNFAIVPG